MLIIATLSIGDGDVALSQEGGHVHDSTGFVPTKGYKYMMEC